MRGPDATPAPDRSKDMALYAIAAGVALIGVLWLAGAGAALLAGHPVPRHRPLGGLAAFGHFGDPSAAWGAPVGPPVLYWTVTFTALGLLVLAAGVGWRMLGRATRREADDPTRVEGLADRHQVVSAAGPKVLLARAAILRPSLSHPRPVDVGFYLGASRGVGCWASVEDSIVVLGPPRSGKGYHLVIPSILDAPGAVITTATRADNLTTTITARAKVGPVAVFDPQGLAAGVPSTLRWSPVRGCQRPQTAMIRAHALCADTGAGTENGSFWRQQTVTAVRCLLHAAALDRRPPADLYRWSLSAPAAKDAVDILVRSANAAPAWEKALDAIISADPRQRDSIWAMVANAFACLGDPQVLAAVTPAEGELFDPAGFLRAKGTLFLLGTATGASATASLVAALVEDVIDVARRMAGISPGARLDPPLGLILDEAANYPLPSLGSLMSEGGGSGITTIAVLQSLAQARDKWGREMGQAIWDAAIAKVILGGGSNADDLADISRLLGERSVREYSETSQAGGGRSISESNRDRPILDPAAIRAIAPGHGLLLLRSARPIMLTLRPWTARSDAPNLASQRARVESSLREIAQEDWGDVA
ncbi:MAG: TraM recognition domain-containing protein [Actinomycetota bacterium]|nr:TraM recognition domain-containing protein [Actinomycetota bacterium]